MFGFKSVVAAVSDLLISVRLRGAEKWQMTSLVGFGLGHYIYGSGSPIYFANCLPNPFKLHDPTHLFFQFVMFRICDKLLSVLI